MGMQGVVHMERAEWDAAAAQFAKALAGSVGRSARAAHYLAAVLLLKVRC